VEGVMAYDGYECLRVRTDDGVAWVTIDHPPINLFDMALIQDMLRVGEELEGDPAVRVVVFESADPDFFIAHADVELIRMLPETAPPKPSTLGFFHAMVERMRTMPKVTIAKIDGIARGGGSEFVLSCDMRFGALGTCVLAQPEVALGIIPGGSGTQRLPRLVGRARAMEIILGCDDVPADLAERWGYLNRALPPSQLGPFVERLARRIASFPAEAIALAKRSVNAADESVVAGLLEEAHCFNLSVATPAARERMAAFMAGGGQTREMEKGVGKLAELLGR
jgi:enoyl-CoA hydratase/carnithine racemase